MGVDPKANLIMGMSPYQSMANNPISNVDPDGDLFWVPIAIGAAIGGTLGGIRANSEGRTFFGGFWRGAVVGGVAGALGQVGGGSLLGNIALGAAEGGLTGGLDAALWGNNIGQGFLQGAKWGAAFAAGTSGIEAAGNAIDGHGFRVNEGVIRNYSKNGQFQDAIDFVQNKYNLTGPQMTYDPTVNDYGVTNLNSGNIRIGPAAFKSPDYLKATIIHEYGHSALERAVVGGKWTWTSPGRPWNYGDGIVGYGEEIRQAGRMHIGRSVLNATVSTPGSNWVYGARTLINATPVNPVWHAKGVIRNKWWHLLPRRF